MKVCKTVQRIPGMLLVWEGPDARPSGGAIVNLSIRNTEKEGGTGTKGGTHRQTEDKKKRMKGRRVRCKERKDGERSFETNHWGETGAWRLRRRQRGVRRRRARKMDEADPC